MGAAIPNVYVKISALLRVSSFDNRERLDPREREREQRERAERERRGERSFLYEFSSVSGSFVIFVHFFIK